MGGRVDGVILIDGGGEGAGTLEDLWLRGNNRHWKLGAGNSVGSDLNIRRIRIPADRYDGIDLRIGNVQERRGCAIYIDLHSSEQRGQEALAVRREYGRSGRPDVRAI